MGYDAHHCGADQPKFRTCLGDMVQDSLLTVNLAPGAVHIVLCWRQRGGILAVLQSWAALGTTRHSGMAAVISMIVSRR
jgi:hypothetical protein